MASFIHTALQRGVRMTAGFGNRLNGFQLGRIAFTALKRGVNESNHKLSSCETNHYTVH
jgi:hypothetical protein